MKNIKITSLQAIDLLEKQEVEELKVLIRKAKKIENELQARYRKLTGQDCR